MNTPPADARSDAQLIALIQKGDEPAFAALYHRHKTYVARLAVRFTGDAELAQDITQEVFAYLVRKLAAPDFQLTAQLTTFLYPVVKHTAQHAQRKARRLAPVDPHHIPEPPDTSADEPDTTDLHPLLKGLSPNHAEVVLLRFVEGLSMEEIAQSLGIPPGTVKSRLHHALKALRQDPNVQKHFEP